MKRFSEFLILTILLLFFGMAASVDATTVTRTGRIITMTSIDADVAWNDSRLFPNADDGVQIFAIIYKPGATDDHFIVREASDTGDAFFEGKCESEYDTQGFEYGGLYYKFYLDAANGTYNAAGKLIINLQAVPDD
jgi:hypothetical protein